MWVAAVNKSGQPRETWHPAPTPADNPTAASKHTQTIPNKTVCWGQICAAPCSVSIVCLSRIYPACCRLCVTACQSCVWTLNMCVCSTERQTDTHRERGGGRQGGEVRVRRDGISGNCLLFSLSVSGENSTLHCLISCLLSFCLLGRVHANVGTFEIASFSLSILAFHPH